MTRELARQSEFTGFVPIAYFFFPAALLLKTPVRAPGAQAGRWADVFDASPVARNVMLW